jgi:hypothetical protein
VTDDGVTNDRVHLMCDFAVQVLKHPWRHSGKTVGVAAGHLTAFEMADIMSKARHQSFLSS